MRAFWLSCLRSLLSLNLLLRIWLLFLFLYVIRIVKVDSQEFSTNLAQFFSLPRIFLISEADQTEGLTAFLIQEQLQVLNFSELLKVSSQRLFSFLWLKLANIKCVTRFRLKMLGLLFPLSLLVWLLLFRAWVAFWLRNDSLRRLFHFFCRSGLWNASVFRLERYSCQTFSLLEVQFYFVIGTLKNLHKHRNHTVSIERSIMELGKP